MANRLSEDGRYTVCLVEAGGSDSTARVQVRPAPSRCIRARSTATTSNPPRKRA
ncbi:GMC family oxidoreductase N-terminal domain-containing protein [Paraburkholderia sediminicola]